LFSGTDAKMRDYAFQGRSYFTAANHKFPFT